MHYSIPALQSTLSNPEFSFFLFTVKHAMVRQYTMTRPRGPRGPYKSKAKKQYTPRRKPSTCLRRTDSTSSSPVKMSPGSPKRTIVTSFGAGASAISLALGKLLLKPKHHTAKQKGRRLNFTVVSYTEIIDYIRAHPAACKLSCRNLDKQLPSRRTFYRVIARMGLDRATRTRRKVDYARFFSKLH